MANIPPLDPRSVLLMTLDSCRYDTFASANVPNLRRIGELHKAMAPGNFTYASHSAMFVGFTPGDFHHPSPYINPQRGRIFYMRRGPLKKPRPDYLALEGRNIIDGFKKRGFLTVGSGAMGWFNPERETSQPLIQDFEHYWYAGNGRSLRKQLNFIRGALAAGGANGVKKWFGKSDPAGKGRPAFVFLNVGETHVPYWHEGADWDRKFNPCLPFADTNDAAECRRRQKACLEFADAQLAPLIDAFLTAGASIVCCGDHGDCWGEDGLWEHSIHHPKVYEVPLLLSLSKAHQPVMS
jgi:hypothetical protein